LWSGLLGGRTAIRPFGRFDHDAYRTHVAAEVPPPPAGSFDGYRDWRRICLAERFAVAAAVEAAHQAGLGHDSPGPETGVFFASSTGGMFETEEYYARLVGISEGKATLRLLASEQVNAPGDAVARQLEISGPVQTVSSACVSGSLAIGLAFGAIRGGEARVAIAGAADSLCRITYGGFNSLRAVDEQPCLPFRQDRAGMSLGEGSGAMVLEPLDDALSRGATPLAEILGFGATNDAHHMTAPHPQGGGAAKALERALEVAAVAPETVDFVNAHGTGTPLNDTAEWAALREVLGEDALRVPVTSTKGSIGHLLGAAGAIEAVVSVLSLQKEMVPPTPADGEIDPAAPVNLVTNHALRVSPMRLGISLNLGFGGSNPALVFSRWNGAGS
jgi:3-oxoacyl-[acyl-carrier-protein] synthase II